MNECKGEEWGRAVVFLSQNDNAFRVILLDVSLCYHAIYEQARSIHGARACAVNSMVERKQFKMC